MIRVEADTGKGFSRGFFRTNKDRGFKRFLEAELPIEVSKVEVIAHVAFDTRVIDDKWIPLNHRTATFRA